ncbi:uncharacterized protein J3D65DRAFT_51391 [Phyllosticta citribraziliensis]|uniref:Mmc1 C-terminal domain-containing protein n=1 Tax=Phyllosticta citribraziliensis TaxID=989973 RepID=A0ABR1MBB5_9PEZI
MPPRINSVQRLARSPFSRPSSAYVCPSCSSWRLGSSLSRPSLPTRTPAHRTRLANLRNNASTLASRTAINAPLEGPPRLKELHQALDALKTDAATYINLSRLQLALRSLEHDDPVVRIAVLSLGDQRAAKRLVRLLLADPLADKGSWEDELEQSGSGNGQAVLLRYGDESDVHPFNPLLRTISVPSRVLQKHNAEILISYLNASIVAPVSSDAEKPRDAILVPTLQTPTSATGRLINVTYPVHRAIVFGEGLESSVAFGRFVASQAEQDLPVDTVKLAVGLPAPAEEPEQNAADKYVAVDVDLGIQALDRFRESIQNSSFFERGWFRSGMPALTTWLAQGTTKEADKLKPAVGELVRSVLAETENAITKDDKRRLQELLASSIPESTKKSIIEALGVWAERAHTELRGRLDLAFAGPYWRKLSWWKLFWRVDDVSMIASDILERRWLTDAEKGLIWVAGRLHEAGFFSSSQITQTQPTSVSNSSRRPKLGDSPPPLYLSDLRKTPEDPVVDTDSPLSRKPSPYVYPQHIPLSRNYLLSSSIPPLQAAAQRLVLQTLSTSGAATALAALLHISALLPTHLGIALSAYEAGGVGAVGIAWSLMRLQKKWEKEREAWEGVVREEGRIALRDAEGWVREVVRDAGQAREYKVAADESATDRRKAREAVERVWRAIESVR